MKQPLMRLRPLSVSLLLSLIFVFHSVNSLDNSYDEDSDLGQKREGRKPEIGIEDEGNDKPIEAIRLSVLGKIPKSKSADSQIEKATHRGTEGLPSGRHIPEGSSDCQFDLDVVSQTSGIITFPVTGYYKKNLTCRWLFGDPDYKAIQFRVNWIDIHSSDRLEIYEGRTESPSSLIVFLKGEVAPSETYTAESSVVLLRFYSDGNDEGKGFQLAYRLIPKEDGNPEGLPSGRHIPEGSSDCQFDLDVVSQTSGIITFPVTGYYKKNLTCRWLFDDPDYKALQFRVNWIDIRSSDRLEIYDGGTASPSHLIVSLKGEVAPSEMYTAKSSVALFRFYSDGNDEGRGFQLIYRLIPKEDGNPEYERE